MNLAKEYLKENGYEDGMVWTLNNVGNLMDVFAKQYAEEMCKKQREICADYYHCNTWVKDLDTGYNKILNAPLATEEK